MGNWDNFWISVKCRTELKAFEKSKPIKCTYSRFCKSKVIVCQRFIRAAVVEPVGLNANWSLNKLLWSLCVRTGYRNLVIINFSRSRHRIDVKEMGRKSVHTFGWLVFGTGVKMLDFHCLGMKEKDIDWLQRNATEFAQKWGSDTQEPMWYSIQAGGGSLENVPKFRILQIRRQTLNIHFVSAF